MSHLKAILDWYAFCNRKKVYILSEFRDNPLETLHNYLLFKAEAENNIYIFNYHYRYHYFENLSVMYLQLTYIEKLLEILKGLLMQICNCQLN